MDVIKRLKQIMYDKGISEYKLAKLSGVPQSTINSMFRKSNNPSIYTLECLCHGLEITMSEFFYQDSIDSSGANNEKLRMLITEWNKLSTKQKDSLLNLLTTFNN